MPMTRLLATVCCALLALPAWAQTRNIPTTRKPPAQGCPIRSAECQINTQVFDFGRAQMTLTAPPVNGNTTISVTCNRAREADQRGFTVEVRYLLKAVPAAPARQMRDQHLAYLTYDMYVDPARTRFWGDGFHPGTASFEGRMILDDRNRVGTQVHVVYGQVYGGQGATFPGQWLGLVGVQVQWDNLCSQ